MSKEFYPYLTEREEKIIELFCDDYQGLGATHNLLGGHRLYFKHEFSSKNYLYIYASLVRKGWLHNDDTWYTLTPTAIEALGL